MPVARIAATGIPAPALLLAGFAVGFAAVPFVAHSAYFAGLGFIVVGRLVVLVASAMAPQSSGRAKDDRLARVLEPIWSASLPFAFALAQPERALAAMFLMLGLVGRAAAMTVDTSATQSAASWAMKSGADLVGMAELSTVYIALCLFPHWFSIAAYVVGIACFVMTGFRVARFGSWQS